MAIPIAVPIVAGVAAAGAIGLRLRKMALEKKVPPKPPAQVIPVPSPTPIAKPAPTPTVKLTQTVESVATTLGVPGTGLPQPPGTRTGTMAELIESLKDPLNFQKNHPDISWDTVTDEQLNAAMDALKAQQAPKASIVVPSTAVVGQQAVVTTNDPSPAGDLIIRDKPNGTQIGGASKGGRVAIIQQVDDTWAEVMWPGDSTYPARRGFARKAFLKLI